MVDVGGNPYFGSPKPWAGRRSVPLPRVAADPLAEHPRRYDRRPDDLVFTAPGGGPVQLNVWRQRFWAPAVRNAGLEHLRPHDLSHMAMALWMAGGANPKEAAARAGHTSAVSRSTVTGTCFRAPSNVSTTRSTRSRRARNQRLRSCTRAATRRMREEKREKVISFAHIVRP